MTNPTSSQVWLDNISHIAGVYTPDSVNASISAAKEVFRTFVFNNFTTGANPAARTQVFNGLLSSGTINSNSSHDVTSFLNTIYTSLDSNNLIVPGFPAVPTAADRDASLPTSPLHGLYNAFLLAKGYDPAHPDISFILTPEITSRLKNQFNSLFSDFLKNLDFSILGQDVPPRIIQFAGMEFSTGDVPYDNFFQAYLRYLSTTTVVQTASAANIASIFDNLNTNTVNYIHSYQTIYESFHGPIGTLSSDPNNWTPLQQVFVDRFTDFYNSELLKTSELNPNHPEGFFDPSQALGSWYSFTQHLYYNPQFSPTAVIPNPRSTIILDEVLKALIAMIGVIQTVASTQANTLNFLSQWQQAYTHKLNQLHTFASGDNTVLGSFGFDDVLGDPNQLGNNSWDRDGAAAIRRDANAVHTSYITKLQANQQTISDKAKALQSNVNQSSDAANQQGSMADSILQEMSTIISAIFR